MESSQKKKEGFRPLDAGSFVSIMDCEDHIELFNRDSYLGAADTNQGWLWFLEQSRLQHYRAKRRWANALTALFGVFFFCALLFLMMAMRSSGGFSKDSQFSVLNSVGTPFEPYHHHLLTEQCHLVTPNDRVDCNPDPPISKEVCQARGCCWLSSGAEARNKNNLNQSSRALPPLNVPYCFFGAEYRGYNLSEVKTAENSGKIAYLHRLRPSGFLKDVQRVKIEVEELSGNVLRIKLTDADAKRYEVPFPHLSLPKKEEEKENDEKKQYRVQLQPETSSLTVYRTSTNTPIFEVNLGRLVYSDQFIQVTSKLPTEYIYGIGEWKRK